MIVTKFGDYRKLLYLYKDLGKPICIDMERYHKQIIKQRKKGIE